MTEQEKEELRRKIEARKQREDAERAGTMNNNQKTCPGCGSVIPANYDVCPVCGTVLKQGGVSKSYERTVKNKSAEGKAVEAIVVGSVGLLSLFVMPLWGVICLAGGLTGHNFVKDTNRQECDSRLYKAGYIVAKTAMLLGAIVLGIHVITLIISLLFGAMVAGGLMMDDLGDFIGSTILPWVRM